MCESVRKKKRQSKEMISILTLHLLRYIHLVRPHSTVITSAMVITHSVTLGGMSIIGMIQLSGDAALPNITSPSMTQSESLADELIGSTLRDAPTLCDMTSATFDCFILGKSNCAVLWSEPTARSV